MKIHTIGYGNRSPEVFFNLLDKAGIRTLVDVWDKPSGRLGCYTYYGDSPKGIVGRLASLGIEYVWVKEFGNPYREDPYWRSKFPDHLSGNWEVGYEKLLKVAEPVCLMCGCLQVQDCHRKYVVDRLQELGHEVEHL